MRIQSNFNPSGVIRYLKKRVKRFIIEVLLVFALGTLVGAGNILYNSYNDGWFGQSAVALAGGCLILCAVFSGLAIDTHRTFGKKHKKDRNKVTKALTLWAFIIILAGLTTTTWLAFPGDWPAWASLSISFIALILITTTIIGNTGEKDKKRANDNLDGWEPLDEGYPEYEVEELHEDDGS